MEIRDFEITNYKNNIRSGFGFTIAFPHILKIQQELPISFHEIVRKKGYPEFEIEKIDNNNVFHFFSNEHDYRIAFGKSLLILIYNGNSVDYQDLKERIEYALIIFKEQYSPAYFKQTRLTEQYSVDELFFKHNNINLKQCVPKYIFPELLSPFEKKIYSLNKSTIFEYNGFETRVDCFLENNNEKLYGVNVTCSYNQNIGDINEIIETFDRIKQSTWNVSQSCITDNLRKVMEEIK